MSRVIPFPIKNTRGTVGEGEDAVLGRIQIDATEAGDVITVNGAFTERMQHGVYALTKALGMFVERIAELGGSGYTSVPAIHEELPRPNKPLPPGIAETDFGELRG